MYNVYIILCINVVHKNTGIKKGAPVQVSLSRNSSYGDGLGMYYANYYLRACTLQCGFINISTKVRTNLCMCITREPFRCISAYNLHHFNSASSMNVLKHRGHMLKSEEPVF